MGLVPTCVFFLAYIWFAIALILLGVNQLLGFDYPTFKLMHTRDFLIVNVNFFEPSQIFPLGHIRIAVCSSVTVLNRSFASEQISNSFHNVIVLL